MEYKRFEEYRYEVDRQFRLRTGCSYKKLGISSQRLSSAFRNKIDPVAFVTDWIRKYNLSDRIR
jgi:hypothetical protein